MKQIRKLATLALIAVVSLLIMKLSGIRYSKSFEEIVNIGKTCIDYLSTWDGLTAGKIVIRIVVIIVGVALVALPLIGLIRSLTKLKEKPVRGPLDFINCFALSFLVVELGYFCRPLLTVSHLTYAVWGVLAVCAILYQVCCLREIKGAEVVVEKQIEKEAVSLEGKTLHVVAGNDEYDAVVVRYEDPVITVKPKRRTNRSLNRSKNRPKKTKRTILAKSLRTMLPNRRKSRRKAKKSRKKPLRIRKRNTTKPIRKDSAKPETT